MLDLINNNIRAKFDVCCLIQKKITHTHKKVVNIYIVYELKLWTHSTATKFTLINLLFGAVKLTKNFDPDKYRYSGYGVKF